MGKSLNRKLHAAKREKNDEFYTQLCDIERECINYKEHFKGKTILCNCDDPDVSMFSKYFELNFNFFGLKKLISTYYSEDKPNYKLEIISNGDSVGNIKSENIIKTPLKGNGDFRSQECIEILKEADIVITNPPFSLFREYVAQIFEYNKKFLILGQQNAITYKDIFTLVKENKMWLGINNGGEKWFEVKDHYDITTKSRKKIEDGKKYFSMGNINWYTNLEHNKRNKELQLYRKYNSKNHPKYDNYDIINVDRITDIPMDYNGIMGVPITILDKYNPNQFEIVGIANSSRYIFHNCFTIIKGKKIYNRILLKNKTL